MDRSFTDEATPIFGLSRSQILPIVENIIGEPVESFDISIDNDVAGEHYGFASEKVIPTFTYTTRSGQKDNITVFVKQYHKTRSERESFHYAELAKLGAPIPLMYGSITKSPHDQREIIFIEHIDPVPDYRPYDQFVKNEEKFLQFIGVTARFDAIKPSDEYASMLRVEFYDESEESYIDRFNLIWCDAQTGKLGDELVKICTDHALERIYLLPKKLFSAERPPPIHLCHDCYEPCHTGWRHRTGEIVIFDLHDITLSPRFSNISLWLGAPDDLQPRCLPRRELAEFYLLQYIHYCDDDVSLEQFLTETRNLWLFEALCLLDRWRKQVIEGEEVYRELLFHLIRCLLREVGF